MEEREKHQPKCKACISQELSAPRECSACHENKTQGKYSAKQWRDLANDGRKCLDCFPEAQEEWLEAKAACLKARDLGYQSYSLPPDGVFDYAKEAPDRAGLVGTYDILYHFNGGLECAPEQRTTRGCLTLQTNKEGQMVGNVVRPKDTPPSRADIFGIDFTFQEEDQEINECDWRMDCLTTSVDSERSKRILALHHINFPSMRRKPFKVRIVEITSRTALPWRCREYWCNDHQEELNVSFETLQEAEDIMERFNDFSKSWICNHLELDDSIARRIHEFVAWRPVPSFFVEPKDLLIATVWRDSMHFHSESYFIARRRTQK